MQSAEHAIDKLGRGGDGGSASGSDLRRDGGIARRVDCDINSRGFAEVSEHELVVLGTHASQLRL